MDIQSFEDLVRSRQSCRSFSTKEVEREKIEKIIELTLLSPSACNSQPWSFIVVSGEAARQMVKYTQVMGSNKFTANVPVFIAVVEEKVNLKDMLGERFMGQDFTLNDIGIAVAHLLLAAKALGLDSCVLGTFKEDEINAQLNIDKKQVRLLVALGYAEDGYPVRKKNRKEKTLATYIE